MYYLCSAFEKIKCPTEGGTLAKSLIKAIMTQQEFTQRTGFYPTAEQFEAIHELYMESDKDKDAWCKEWKRKGGVEKCSKENVINVESLRRELTTNKLNFDHEIDQANTFANYWRENFKLASSRAKELEEEIQKLQGVLDNIRMILQEK